MNKKLIAAMLEAIEATTNRVRGAGRISKQRMMMLTKMDSHVTIQSFFDRIGVLVVCGAIWASGAGFGWLERDAARSVIPQTVKAVIEGVTMAAICIQWSAVIYLILQNWRGRVTRVSETNRLP
jgi:hypothetical protein